MRDLKQLKNLFKELAIYMPKCIGCQTHEHFGKEKEKNNQMLGLSHIFYNLYKPKNQGYINNFS